MSLRSTFLRPDLEPRVATSLHRPRDQQGRVKGRQLKESKPDRSYAVFALSENLVRVKHFLLDKCETNLRGVRLE